MGIDFSHCDAHWSYSVFHRFRVKLAKEIGINLDSMKGFDFADPDKGMPWTKIKDPIVFLLDHSDCDGELTADECHCVAPRLRELVADWPDDDYDRQQALLLADGMDKAVQSGENLIFH